MSPFTATGKCSIFGGPQDTGVGPHEDLALYERPDVADAPAGLFLERQPPGTTGTARRLNPQALYCALRFARTDGERSTVKPGLGVCLPVTTPTAWLRKNTVQLTAHGHTVRARVVDWGPNSDTGRLVDLSPGAAAALGVSTDAMVTVTMA